MNRDAAILTADPPPPCPPDAGTTDRHGAAVRFLLDRINYERTPSIPYSERTLKLARMRELLDRLGKPQSGMPIVHVAGTKGKGSTSAMIASILSAAGLRTGLFTSPHLDQIEERFCVDGRPCSENELINLVDRVRTVATAMDSASNDPSSGPTYFELTTAIALFHFATRQVDAAVLEVGMGGRLDSTNVCLPAVCAITSISYDHTKQLGNSLSAIAKEKAGILKPGVPGVSGVCKVEPRDVIAKMARQQGSPLLQMGLDFDFHYTPPKRIDVPSPLGCFDYMDNSSGKLSNLPVPLHGRHQAANAAVAVAVVRELQRQGWTIDDSAIHRGLSEVRLPARIEVLRHRPTVIVDAAHNVASANALVEAIQTTTIATRRTLILAATREKDIHGILRKLLPHFDRVIVTQYLNNPRAIPAEELAENVEAVRHQLGNTCRAVAFDIRQTPTDAWMDANAATGPDDLICAAGSFFIASEIRRIVLA